MYMRGYIKRISHGKSEPLFYLAYNIFTRIQCFFLAVKWYLKGYRKPTKHESEFVVQNVTFIFKSFERQKLARRLYHNIQAYYPGAQVIIADDSFSPLDLHGKGLTVLQLPPNSGLSYGLNRALEQVKTKYVMRMDDDELLTPLTKVHDELKFLQLHSNVDLIGFGVMSTPDCTPPTESSDIYYRQPMNDAPKPLKIKHLTPIDDQHIVLGKTTNVFLAETVKLREIGWDDHIRMIDHNEFFIRAAGNLVSVLNPFTVILHCHNRFNRHYQSYRSDIIGDQQYIQKKHLKE